MSDKQQYRILDVLGQGQLGTVCLAERVGPPAERLALKLFNPQASAGEPMERLQEALPLLAWTRHPVILRPQALVRFDAQWALAMEAVEGCDLRRLLMTGPMPAGPAMELVAVIAGALNAVYYQAGPDGDPLRLLHGDLKPANLLLTPWGEVRLLDFGVLRALEGPDPAASLDLAEETRTAPEHFEGVLSPAGDIYALGCTLYEMLCGHPCPAAGRDGVEHRRVLARVLRGLEQAEADPLASTLVEAMLAWEGEARPIARDVEKLARELRRSVPGPSLREWAHDAVDHALEMSKPGRDARVGTVMWGAAAAVRATPRAAAPTARRADLDELPGPSPSRSSRVGALRDPEEEETITRTMPGGRPPARRMIDPDATEMMSPIELAVLAEVGDDTGEVERTDAVVARLSVPGEAMSAGAALTGTLSERDVDPLPPKTVQVPAHPPGVATPPPASPPSAPIFRGAGKAAVPSAVPAVPSASAAVLPGFVPDPPLPPRTRVPVIVPDAPPPPPGAASAADTWNDGPDQLPVHAAPGAIPPVQVPHSAGPPAQAAPLPDTVAAPVVPDTLAAPGPDDVSEGVPVRPPRDLLIMAMPAGCVVLALLAIVAVYAYLHLR